MQPTREQIRARTYKPFQHLWCLHVIGMSSTLELYTNIIRVEKNHANHLQKKLFSFRCCDQYVYRYCWHVLSKLTANLKLVILFSYSCHSSCLFSLLTQSISSKSSFPNITWHIFTNQNDTNSWVFCWFKCTSTYMFHFLLIASKSCFLDKSLRSPPWTLTASIQSWIAGLLCVDTCGKTCPVAAFGEGKNGKWWIIGGLIWLILAIFLQESHF